MWEKIPSKRVLIEDLMRVKRKLGRWPSVREYQRYGKYGKSTFYKYFGGYRYAIEVAKREERGRTI